MRIGMLILLVLLIHSAYAELVRIDFEVKDIDGKPIAGAVISISTSKRLSLPYQKPEKKKFSCTTGKDGAVTERFFCWDGYVNCHVSAEGFYSEKLPEMVFKTNYNRKTDRTEFFEDCQKVCVTLRPMRQPIPLYAYRGDERYLRFGKKECKIGYDLQKKDWIPPQGNGEVADFYIHHWVEITNNLTACYAEMTFSEGGGAYVERGINGLQHPMVYCANTNNAYKLKFDGVRISDDSKKTLVEEKLVLLASEALVIRSRVTLDENRRIVKANYSKIYGPFSIARFFEFGQSCFNPNVNDTNLEFDTHKNLADKNIGTFYP